MKTKFYYALIIIWTIIITTSSISPVIFNTTLKKLYPNAVEITWSQKENYYIATFIQDGFEKKTWMNANAQWVMTNTELQTTDQLTPGAYNNFTFSPYSTWTVNNVNFIEFPRQPSMYVITVNQENSVSTYQLFYTPDGRLLQTRDISYASSVLSPEVFNI